MKLEYEFKQRLEKLPFICMEEVQKHNSKDDIWTVVDGVVYDVTQYVPLHPGGKKILLGAGKESTKMFGK